MSTQTVVTPTNLGNEFDIGVIEANKIHIKLDSTLQRDGTGQLGVVGAAVTVVSADTGNLLNAGTDTGALLVEADLTTAVANLETDWTGADASNFMAVTAGGTNGHAATFVFDWNNAAFIEAVQDAVGAAVLAGAGVTYDDVANSISTTLGNLTFTNGIDLTGTTVTIKPDPASPSAIAVAPAGLSVTPGISADAGNLASAGTDSKVMVAPAGVTALATVDVCDAFGVSLFNAFP